jgi:hypothetical protein
MSKVRGRSLNSNAIHFQVIINETLCHGQHLRDRIRAACGCLFSTGFLCSMSALAILHESRPFLPAAFTVSNSLCD